MRINLSKALNERIVYFFEDHPPLPFSNFLRNMVLEYIREHIRMGFRLNFHRHLWTLEDLFELLDIAEEEIRKQKRTQELLEREIEKKAIKQSKSKTISRSKK